MKDAFGNEIKVGDKVMCCTEGNTNDFYVGEITRLRPKEDLEVSRRDVTPDRVSIRILINKEGARTKSTLLRADQVASIKAVTEMLE